MTRGNLLLTWYFNREFDLESFEAKIYQSQYPVVVALYFKILIQLSTASWLMTFDPFQSVLVLV